ncbi:unnamed protein product [Nippostrongylus brasiliensis]|uniref:Uncharacterized protein n=1 Tax=Nippostrongylus brasiliensis TaxID=27835 RepID=A0A0N4XV88_NIPBR|nr:unnamed protein product [Nippostrongylus brasiliensis]
MISSEPASSTRLDQGQFDITRCTTATVVVVVVGVVVRVVRVVGNCNPDLRMGAEIVSHLRTGPIAFSWPSDAENSLAGQLQYMRYMRPESDRDTESE